MQVWIFFASLIHILRLPSDLLHVSSDCCTLHWCAARLKEKFRRFGISCVVFIQRRVTALSCWLCPLMSKLCCRILRSLLVSLEFPLLCCTQWRILSCRMWKLWMWTEACDSISVAGIFWWGRFQIASNFRGFGLYNARFRWGHAFWVPFNGLRARVGLSLSSNNILVILSIKTRRLWFGYWLTRPQDFFMDSNCRWQATRIVSCPVFILLPRTTRISSNDGSAIVCWCLLIIISERQNHERDTNWCIFNQRTTSMMACYRRAPAQWLLTHCPQPRSQIS